MRVDRSAPAVLWVYPDATKFAQKRKCTRILGSSRGSETLSPQLWPRGGEAGGGSSYFTRVDPAEYPTRAARQWIPPSIPLPAEYPAEYPLPVDPAEYAASIETEGLASVRQWISPGPRQSSSPVWFCLMSRPTHSWVYISYWCLRVLSVP